MKGNSSHLANHKLALNDLFKWQGTYGARSVDPSGIESVIAYIENQRDHHDCKTTIPEWEVTEEFVDSP